MKKNLNGFQSIVDERSHKTMKKLALFIGAALSMSLLFAGCSSSTPTETSATPSSESSVSGTVESGNASVAGTTWKLVDGTVTDPSTGNTVASEDLVALLGSLSLTFNNDGTFTFTYGDVSSEGTYVQDGSIVTITEQSGETASFSVEGGLMSWDINGNILILSQG